MAYTPTVWTQLSAPFINATNLNKMETGIDEAHESGNIAFLQSGTGAVATDVQTKLRQFISVKDFGATGDGVTDDTAEIQAAIDASYAAGGGVVFIPKGTYLVSSPIQMRKMVRVVGETIYLGPGSLYTGTSVEGGYSGVSELIATSGITTAVVYFDFADGTRERRPYGAVVRDLVIDAANAGGTADALYVAPVTSSEGPFDTGFASDACEIERVVALNAPRHGIHVYSIPALQRVNLKILSCRAAFNGVHGINLVGANDVFIEKTYSFANNGSGLYSEGCGTGRVIESDFFNNGQSGTAAAYQGNGITDDSREMRYISCHVDNNYRHGMEFVAAAAGAGATANKQTRIIGCRISSNGGDDAAGTYDNVKIGTFSGAGIGGLSFMGCKIGGSQHSNGVGKVGYQINLTTAPTQNANSIVGCMFATADLATATNVLSDPAAQTSVIAGSTTGDQNILKQKAKEIPAWTGSAAVNTLTGALFYKTANVAGAVINGITGGNAAFAEGREVWILINDANTGVDFTFTALNGNGGVDLAAGAGTEGKLLHCKNYDGTNWACAIYG